MPATRSELPALVLGGPSIEPVIWLLGAAKLIKRTAICDRRHGRYQLQRRYTNLLSHGNRSNGNWRPILKPAQQSSALAGKINAGLLAKSECADILVKFRRANSYCDLDGSDVARLRQNVGHR